jgi:hypothetical protein
MEWWKHTSRDQRPNEDTAIPRAYVDSRETRKGNRNRIQTEDMPFLSQGSRRRGAIRDCLQSIVSFRASFSYILIPVYPVFMFIPVFMYVS